MKVASDVWGAHILKHATAEQSVRVSNLKEIFAAASASQRGGEEDVSAHPDMHHSPAATFGGSLREEGIKQWLGKQNDVNAEQKSFLEIVSQQVLRENAQPEGPTGSESVAPMRWLLHGKPGTGKSHVIKKLQEFLQEVVGYKQDVHFKTIALQATMAAQISGDTIHHALHIRKGDRYGAVGSAALPSENKLAKCMILWRWLIIDEISMISARFLADIDMRLRAAARAIGTMKYDSCHQERPFGGLNVIFAGDFCQLDPPEPGGWSLSRIPTWCYEGTASHTPAPTSEYGLTLFWSDDRNVSLTGLTELVRQERCVDPWYSLLLDECREGRLSDNNHKFLHGKPTTVPGSWMDDPQGPYTSCGQAQCRDLGVRNTTAEEVLKRECSVCSQERRRRARVAQSADDERFTTQMHSAPLIVPNNDVKMHTNKERGHLFAVNTGTQLIWIPAKDVASAEVLKEAPTDAPKKLQWLQRHDRQSGDLYGMLPICFGMPVFLMDHLDRSRDRNLLRGTRGTVES